MDPFNQFSDEPKVNLSQIKRIHEDAEKHKQNIAEHEAHKQERAVVVAELMLSQQDDAVETSVNKGMFDDVANALNIDEDIEDLMENVPVNEIADIVDDVEDIYEHDDIDDVIDIAEEIGNEIEDIYDHDDDSQGNDKEPLVEEASEAGASALMTSFAAISAIALIL